MSQLTSDVGVDLDSTCLLKSISLTCFNLERVGDLNLNVMYIPLKKKDLAFKCRDRKYVFENC